MDTWKPSTFVVFAAFILSVGLLVVAKNPLSQRQFEDKPVVESEVFSPAAAETNLRNKNSADEWKQKVRKNTPKKKPADLSIKHKVLPKKPKVESEPKKLEKVAKPTQNKPLKSHQYYVIVGTYSTELRAKKALADFRKAKMGSPFVKAFPGPLYKVVAKSFKNEPAARAFVKTLRKKQKFSDAYINFVGA